MKQDWTILGLGSFGFQTCKGLQFCHNNVAQNIDLCMAITTTESVTSQTLETNFLISAKFAHRRGWAAFGVGDSMSTALMLVVYPGRNMDRRDFQYAVSVGC